MLTDDDIRAGFRSYFGRAAGPADSVSSAAEAGEPAAFPMTGPRGVVAGVRIGAQAPAPTPTPTTMLAATGDARVLRRLRHVVRRRVRIELDGPVRRSVSDGDIALDVRTVTSREGRTVEWTADRLVGLVVLHDGCGARVIGGGGVIGRVELPSVTCAGAFLAFCYDTEAGQPS